MPDTHALAVEEVAKKLDLTVEEVTEAYEKVWHDECPSLQDNLVYLCVSQAEELMRLKEVVRTEVAQLAMLTGRTFNWDVLEKVEANLRSELEKTR